MLRCPTCAAQWPDDHVFCGDCGLRLPAARPEAKVACRQCGAEHPLDTQFCTECGSGIPVMAGLDAATQAVPRTRPAAAPGTNRSESPSASSGPDASAWAPTTARKAADPGSRCPKCSTPMTPDLRFCLECGAPAIAASESAAATSSPATTAPPAPVGPARASPTPAPAVAPGPRSDPQPPRSAPRGAPAGSPPSARSLPAATSLRPQEPSPAARATEPPGDRTAPDGGSAPASFSGIRWEYANFTVTTIQGNEKLVAKLNELGAEGWELVGFQAVKDKRGDPAITGLLKRPCLDDSKA